MLRFYAVESTPTNTGGKADHRLPLRASEIEAFARALAAQLGAGGGGQFPAGQQKFAAALAKDLLANRGRSVVVVGDNQPVAVHMLAHAMNQALGNVGQTVFYTDWIESHPVNKTDSLRQLAGEMWTGKIDMLFLIGVNPLYDAPPDLNFSGAMQKVGLRVHHGLYQDETARLCHWHINATHYLEQWGDCRAFDGTISLIQPLIAPLYGGRSAFEVLGALVGEPDTNSYEVVYRYWQEQHNRLTRRAETSTPSGASRCTMDSWPAARSRPSGERAGGKHSRIAGASGRHGNHVPLRPQHFRRPLCQQRMAAGAAETDHPDDLGQSRPDERAHRQEARNQDRRCR